MANKTFSEALAEGSLGVTEGEMLVGGSGDAAEGAPLAGIPATKDGTVVYPGVFDVQSTTIAAGGTDVSTVDLSALGSGALRISVMITAVDGTSARHRKSYLMNIERWSGALLGDDLASPVEEGSGDSQTAEPSTVTFADSAGDLAITISHTIVSESLAVTTSTSVMLLPYSPPPV